MHKARLRTYVSLAVALWGALLAVTSAQTLTLPTPVGMNGDPAERAVLLGNAAFLHGDLRGAAAYYHDALQRKHDFAIATFNLGLVEMHTGETARGRTDMDRGIDIATKHGMSQRDVGRLRELRAAFNTQAKPA